MATLREHDIRELAYTLWDEAGRPEGNDHDCWFRAERELAEAGRLDMSAEAAEVALPAVPAGLAGH